MEDTVVRHVSLTNPTPFIQVLEWVIEQTYRIEDRIVQFI